MKCEERFFEIYGKINEGLAFCPYRICPLGAHSDHQNGKVTGFAIDKGIHIAYRPKRNGVVEMSSLNFEKRAQWHISSTPKTKEYDWADYLRGATLALARRHSLEFGICGVIEGSLPIGGLSSSAAVTISFISALASVNNIKLTREETVTMALEAENKYVGVSCGKLDQSCEIYGKKDHLLYLDTQDDSYELIPTSPKMKPYKIAVFFSGIERNLAGSKFNVRVDECRAAAYALKAFSKMEYGTFDETHLREVPLEVFDKYKYKLPDNWSKRAEHWYTEFDRVQKGVKAWRNGDIETFGKLSFESGYSSIHNYETGSEELKTLYEIMLNTDGIYGGRFSGAGFKGCCIALIDPSFEEKIAQQVEYKYLKVFPNLKNKFATYFCVSANGVEL